MTESTSAPPPAAPRPIRFAASLIVLRNGPAGLEVLMLRRAEKEADQNSGASVFPGGGVDPHDRLLHGHCGSVTDLAASRTLELPSGGLDFYIAAIRECFEEAGLLFARTDDGRAVALDTLAEAEVAALRARAEAGGAEAWLQLCAERGWQFDAERLAYFAHWLTPPGMPRRFDTRFFVALAPPSQTARPDGRETVEHQWLRPADAVAPERGLRLMNVTRRVLLQLAAFDSAEDCLAHARALSRIPLVMPRLASGPAGRLPVNPDEPAYAEIGRIDPEGAGHGRYELGHGLAMAMSPRIVRLTARHAGVLRNSYFVGHAAGGWALIDPAVEDEGDLEWLRASAPGPVRWIVSTRLQMQRPLALQRAQALWPEAEAPWAERSALAGVGLQWVEAGDPQSRWLLLEEERTLFTGDFEPPAGFGDSRIDWFAPAQGFLRRR
ncbi:NUDIX domain-containing protein [Variovorax sp. J22P168]|uniref:NUDIX hydrolase n=1 Tax=Variovorax jilinensis TaxID=3053513 RepID=UPI002574BE94|nr:NUDIX domain-containing protein [Variovorax sp. J22P168]MDM0013554.1 NUDIX domain-containing protein [Variovorax sp. J22P168]